MRELLLRPRCAHGVVVQILAIRLRGGGALVVDGGRSVVAAVTGTSPSWWLPAMVGHGG